MKIYDFDKTIYNGDSTLDFYLFALRKKPSLLYFLPRQALGFALYKLGKIDKTRLKEYFFSFLRGIEAQALLEQFWQTNQHKLSAWYLRQSDAGDLVISASPEFLLRPICRTLGIREPIASRVDIKTGKFSGENCRGEEKLTRYRELFGETEIEEFYSDSESDLPLARLASTAFLIKNGKAQIWNI